MRLNGGGGLSGTDSLRDAWFARVFVVLPFFFSEWTSFNWASIGAAGGSCAFLLGLNLIAFGILPIPKLRKYHF